MLHFQPGTFLDPQGSAGKAPFPKLLQRLQDCGVLRCSRQEPLLVTIQGQVLEQRPEIGRILQIKFQETRNVWHSKCMDQNIHVNQMTCMPTSILRGCADKKPPIYPFITDHSIRPETLGSNSSRHQRSPESGTSITDSKGPTPTKTNLGVMWILNLFLPNKRTGVFALHTWIKHQKPEKKAQEQLQRWLWAPSAAPSWAEEGCP